MNAPMHNLVLAQYSPIIATAKSYSLVLSSKHMLIYPLPGFIERHRFGKHTKIGYDGPGVRGAHRWRATMVAVMAFVLLTEEDIGERLRSV